MSEIVYVIAITIRMLMPEGPPEDIMVQWRGVNHGIYSTKMSCDQSLEYYGEEHIVNLFLDELNHDTGTIPFPKMMPKCVKYNRLTGIYPDYPEFDIPMNKPNDGQGVKNDGLGRSVSGSS